jgi:hypothetical protein
MSYSLKGYKTRGIEGVSAVIGAEEYLNLQLHDDGVKGYGGERSVCIGPMRGGKTTLALITLPRIYYISNGTKEEWFASKDPNKLDLVKPETIIYRGRKLDYWNCYTKENFSKCFPKDKERELKVFIYYQDDTRFLAYNQKTGMDEPIPNLNIYRYREQSDLYDNLIEGGINVIYVPNAYTLSPFLKNAINEMMMLNDGDTNFLAEQDDISVIRETFWYDFFYYLMDIEKNRDDPDDHRRKIKFITFFFDEAHQIFPANEPKPFWYLIDNFAENVLIDTGRMNISIYANIHHLNLMYWKVLQRFVIFEWLLGSFPDKKYSMVSDKLPRHMWKGLFLIERKQQRFGKMEFPRIPNQPDVVLARGVPS